MRPAPPDDPETAAYEPSPLSLALQAEALRAEHSTRRYELISSGDAGWLRGEPGVQIIEFDGGYALFDVDSEATAQRVLRQAVALGDVASFSPQHPTLAQIFKEVIQ